MKSKLAVPPLPSCGGQEDILVPPLDFEGCVNMLGGDRAMIRGLLLEFSGHLDVQLKAIAVALAEADADVVCRVAHSIKGGAAVLSAHSLMRAAAVLEEIGKSGDLLKGKECFLVLEREVGLVCCYCKGLTDNDA